MSAGSLTRERLEALLERLDADPQRAAAAYEALRVRLVRFFVWQGSPGAEEAADETLDRMARRVEEGEEVQDPYRYVVGVARNVLRESRSRQLRETSLRERWPAETALALGGPHSDPPSDDARLECLGLCLKRVDAEARRLLLEYHRGEKRDQIERRRRLADSLGLSPVALRVRVHRLRAVLEVSVRRCLERRGVTSSRPGPRP